MVKYISHFLNFCVTFFIIISFSSGIQGYEIGKIAAVVNEHIISVADLEHRLKLAIVSAGLEDTAQVRSSLRDQILKSMIDETLQIITVTKFDLKPAETEIQQSFDELENRNNMKPGQLKEVLKENNIPLDIIYKQIGANDSWRKYIYARYHQIVQISEEEIERAIKKYKVKKDKTQYLIAEIFLSAETEQEKILLKKRASDFVQQLRKGAHFSALAQQFSQSASSARGGDIGWVTEDELDPSLTQAIINLKPNETSEVIDTENGIYIILLRDRRAPGESIGKDTLLSFIQVLFPASQPFSDELLSPIFAKAKSISVHAKSCGLLQTLVKGDQKTQLREVQKAHTSEMIPQLRELLMNLAIGQVTEPILTEMGFILFMVCQKEDINPDNPTREDVKGRLIEQKLEHLAHQEIIKLRRSAHIDIRNS